MNIQDILEYLPHRFPFLLVDRVLECVPGESLKAVKNISVNEPFFPGHFPGQPVMPGVLQVEAMAQAGGLLAMKVLQDRRAQVVYFMSIDKVKFRRPVIPGDQLRMEVEIVKMKGKIAKFAGKAYVGDKVACEAELMATLSDRR